jgi:hypothetical protein
MKNRWGARAVDMMRKEGENMTAASISGDNKNAITKAINTSVATIYKRFSSLPK